MIVLIKIITKNGKGRDEISTIHDIKCNYHKNPIIAISTYV